MCVLRESWGKRGSDGAGEGMRGRERGKERDLIYSTHQIMFTVWSPNSPNNEEFVQSSKYMKSRKEREYKPQKLNIFIFYCCKVITNGVA